MWEISNIFQWITLGRAVLLGAIIDLIYDIFRLFTFSFNLKAFGRAVSDIIFWLIAAVITFCFLIVNTSGQVRFYVFVGMAMGFFAFRLTVSRFIFFNFKAVRRFVLKLKKIYNRLILRVQKFSFKVSFNKTKDKIKVFLSKKRKIS